MKLKIFLIATSIMFAGAFMPPPLLAQNPSGDSAVEKGVATSTALPKDSIKAVVTTVASSVQADSVTVKTSDTTAVKVPSTTITAPSNLTFFGVTLPAWLLTIITSILTILPGIQLVLKRTAGAAPIAGVVGKILNFLTAFQENVVQVPPPTTTTTSGLSSK